MIVRLFHTLLAVLSLVVLSHTTELYRARKPTPKIIKKPDNSVQFRRYDEYGHYSFGYETVTGSRVTTFHREIGDAQGNKAGTYGFTNGQYVRVVNYVADENGFKATVQSNEPGVSRTPQVILRLPDTLTLWKAKNLEYSY